MPCNAPATDAIQSVELPKLPPADQRHVASSSRYSCSSTVVKISAIPFWEPPLARQAAGLFDVGVSTVVRWAWMAVSGHAGDDVVHEVEEFNATPALLMGRRHLAGGHLERGKQRRCAIALVVVAVAIQRSAVRQLQIALRPLQRLDRGDSFVSDSGY
jgi:hypothetical protein